MPCPLARGCSGGLLCTFSTVQSWVQIVSQNSENLLILLLPDSTRDQDLSSAYEEFYQGEYIYIVIVG